MASPNTMAIRWMQFDRVTSRPTRKRDRSLAGKKRTKARKLENKASFE